jgi:hypothetical protein
VLVFLLARQVEKFIRQPAEDLTGQPDNQSLTIYFVGDFLFVARFLLGFGVFYNNWYEIIMVGGG